MSRNWQPRSLIDIAKDMLFDELRKQPLLQWFAPLGEQWKLDLVPTLIELGYITGPYYGQTPAGSAPYYRITAKGQLYYSDLATEAEQRYARLCAEWKEKRNAAPSGD